MTSIVRRRGDTYADEFVIKSKRTGLPIDITDCSFLMTLDSEKDPTDDSTNIYQLVGEVISGPDGRVAFAPSEQDADRIGEFFYDVQMIDGEGRTRTVVKARYKYTQDITK